MSRRMARAKQNRCRKNQAILENIVVEDDRKVGFGRGAERKFVARVRPANPSQEDYMAAIDFADVVFGIGPAGTGKTYIAVALALEMLAAKRVSKIILSRPAMEAEGEKLGFLPGNLSEKIEPYLMPIYDVLNERIGKANTRKLLAEGTIELCPLAFMRGRTFSNAAFILDEMQNASIGQIKMALTRIGEGTKTILTGDPDQAGDLGSKESGLLPAARALEGAPGIEIVKFSPKDVVRSAVVKTVLERI